MRTLRGHTLIELAATAVIVALLAGAVLPLTELVQQRAREHELRRALRDIRGALDAYKQAADEGRIAQHPGASGYPARLEELAAGVEDLHNPGRHRLYFLRRIPRDPLSADAVLTPAETWGKRSYASPADAPREGADVFDVHSRAAGLGLDGRPYAEW